jgi:hypothetical protein
LLPKSFASLCLMVALAYGASTCAAEQCDASRPKKTAFGALVLQKCSGDRTHFDVIVDGVQVLTDVFLSREDFDKTKGVWIYSNGGTALYLVDLSKKPVVVWRFGVRMSTNEFEFASWGKDRVVIAIKNNTRFTYQDGKIKLPNQDWVVEHTLINAGNMRFNSDGSVSQGVVVMKFIPFAEGIRTSQ